MKRRMIVHLHKLLIAHKINDREFRLYMKLDHYFCMKYPVPGTIAYHAVRNHFWDCQYVS